MSRILALVEGHSEQAFVTSVLASDLGYKGVYVTAALIGKPGRKGGVRRYDVVRKDILALLRQDPTRYCTTMFDYHGLPNDWPRASDVRGRPPSEMAEHVEQAMRENVVDAMGPSFNEARFIPYIQMHEFEALLFSDPAKLATVIQPPNLAVQLRRIADKFGDPEAIDDGDDTAPSRRLRDLAAHYQKVVHGTIAAQRIGLATMRDHCTHFARWVESLENLRA